MGDRPLILGTNNESMGAKSPDSRPLGTLGIIGGRITGGDATVDQDKVSHKCCNGSNDRPYIKCGRNELTCVRNGGREL